MCELKLKAYEGVNGKTRDCWVLDAPTSSAGLFVVVDAASCHIQRRGDGKYGFNRWLPAAPRWVGPTFDSLEEIVLWVQMTGADRRPT